MCMLLYLQIYSKFLVQPINIFQPVRPVYRVTSMMYICLSEQLAIAVRGNLFDFRKPFSRLIIFSAHIMYHETGLINILCGPLEYRAM